MNKLERKMYIAMQNSKWWPVGDEAIEDMTKLAMEVANEYIDEIDNILLCGYDPRVKVESIIYLHHDLIKGGDNDQPQP